MNIEGGRHLQKRSPSNPVVSIITVVFRARRDLRCLIENVLRLKNEQVEFIVIDGGSEDGTSELLCEYGPNIDYWVSEPDHGIYDAMNKGIAASRGTWILHLNAGDQLLSIPITDLEAATTSAIDVAAFRVLIDGSREFRPSYGIGLRFNNTLHHQGTFYRKEMLPTYDTGYKIFADFDVNQRLALRGARVKIFDKAVSIHMTDGVSNVSTRAAVSEFFDVIAKNYGWSYLAIAWLLCKWRGLESRLDRFRSQGP